MEFFTYHKEVDFDLNEFRLDDALKKLKRERFFDHNSYFYLVRQETPDHLVFSIRHWKTLRRLIYEFRYLRQERKWEVKGRYKNIAREFLIFLFLPVVLFLLGFYGSEPVLGSWSFLILTGLGVTILNLILMPIVIRTHAEAIERELIIRLKQLLRQKGINGEI